MKKLWYTKKDYQMYKELLQGLDNCEGWENAHMLARKIDEINVSYYSFVLLIMVRRLYKELGWNIEK